MWFNKKLTTIVLGQRDIRLLTANHKGIQCWESQDIPPGWIQSGRIVERQNVAAVIGSLRRSLPVSGEAIVSVGGLAFIQRTVVLPSMKASMIDEAIRYQLRDDTSVPAQKMNLTWRVMGEHDDEVTFGVTGIDASLLADIEETMRLAGVRYWSLELQSLALRRLLPLSNMMLLNLEKDSFEVCRFIDGEPATVYTVHLDESVAGSQGYAEQVLSVATNALRQRQNKYPGQKSETTFPVFLTGILADDLRLVGAITDELGNATGLLKSPEGLPQDFPFHQYSTNVGLLACSKAHAQYRRVSSPSSSQQVDVLGGRYRRQPVSISVVPWAIILILVVVVGHLLPIYAGRNANANTLQLLQDEYKLASLQLVHDKQVDAAQTELKNQINKLLQQAKTLEEEIIGVIGNPGELTRHLQAIVRALPAKCSFGSISISDDGITLRVWSESIDDLFSYTDALSALDSSHQVRVSLIQETTGQSHEVTVFEFEVVIKT